MSTTKDAIELRLQGDLREPAFDYTLGKYRFSTQSGCGLRVNPEDGFPVMMTPATFLGLVPELEHTETLAHIDDLTAEGEPLQPPTLSVDFHPDNDLDSYPAIVGHDGRHRMSALLRDGYADIEVPVVIASTTSVAELDGDHIITLRTAVWAQTDEACEPRRLARGPHFGQAFLNGQILAAGELDELHPFIPRT